MTVEIAEIGIRMVVGDPATPPAAKAGDRTPALAPLTQPQMDALVQACVQQVLSALRMQRDR